MYNVTDTKISWLADKIDNLIHAHYNKGTIFTALYKLHEDQNAIKYKYIASLMYNEDMEGIIKELIELRKE